MTRILTSLLAPLLVLALSATAAQSMSVKFSWGPTKSCFDRKSPPIKLSGVPKGTKNLVLRLKDLDAPTYPHGGSKRKYKGKNTLAYGYFNYKGPCPPRPQTHRYRITIRALNAAGKTIGRASATRKFKQ